VGAYNAATGSGGPDLAELLQMIASVSGITRVRLSSIQPIEISDALIEVFSRYKNICPHLHLSCQSGDDTILRAMNRPYDTAYYQGLVARLRERIPDVAITTDLIVGYPGETRQMHENTLRFARAVQFQRTHVFTYSPRPGTYAATLRDDVPEPEKQLRRKELQSIVNESNAAFTSRYLGDTVPVLVEGKHGEGGTVNGHTPNYIKVTFPGDRRLLGQVVPVRLTQVTDEGAEGNLMLSNEEVQALIATMTAPKAFTPLSMAHE
jgi:threonylcarbamoyladenosine tRNA methylthiotransferase MtaB